MNRIRWRTHFWRHPCLSFWLGD